MKNFVLSLTIFLLLALFPLVGKAGDQSLVLYFTFDEAIGNEVTDESGNNHTGVLQGGTEWTKDGKYDGAIFFDGIDGVVTVKHDESLNLSGGSFTIAVWVYPTLVDNTFQTFIDKSHTNDDLDYVLFMRNDNKAQFASRTGCSINIKNLGPELSSEKWCHVAAVQDDKSKTVTLYVDGAAIGSQPIAGDETVSDSDFRIGSRDGSTFFGGIIDEVAIFASALTELEINKLMKGIESFSAVANPSSSLAITWGRIKG